jgi:DNA repair exonuclease SbcCD ATPase subunit
MEREDMRTQVRAMVDDLFNEKEESEIRRKTEMALEKSADTISDLTATLEDKVAEMAEFETKLSESEESVQTLEKELEATQGELETSKSLLKEKEQAIEDMNKTKVADERMNELEAAGVARAEKEVQLTKVKEMSNEEFTSYKEELVCIRSAVEVELEKANEELKTKKAEEEAKTAEEKTKAAEKTTTKKEETATQETSEEVGEVDTTPAKINPGQSAMAALNMEYMPDSDLMTKYAKLGEALAAKWKKESKE